MVKESLSMPTVMFSGASGMTITQRVAAFSHTPTAMYTREAGSWTAAMALASLRVRQMATAMRASGTKAGDTELVLFIYQTATPFLAPGKRDAQLDQSSTALLTTAHGPTQICKPITSS